jgi:hypothetical protein
MLLLRFVQILLIKPPLQESASGHLQTFGEPSRMSALPPKADIGTLR